MVLLDTCAAIHLGQGNQQVLHLISNAKKNNERVLLSTISVFELSTGNPPRIDERRKKLINSFEVVPFHSTYAELAGVIFRELKSTGLDIGSLDCMIAAVALCENQPLITRNIKHFSRVKGLQVIKY